MGQLLLTRHYGKPELLAQFDTFVRGRVAASTRQVYASVLRRFAEHVVDLVAPSDPFLKNWVCSRRRAVSRSTLCTELAALRAFYKWLHAAGFTPRDESLRLPRPQRPPQRLARYLDVVQIDHLLAAPDQLTFVGLRDYAVMRLAYETGARAQEIVELALGDVLADGFLYVRGRHAPISAAMIATLDRWQRMRHTARPGKRAALFITHRGKPFRNANAVWVIVNRYARRALGLVRGYERLTASAKRRPWAGHHPSLLRTSCAAHLLQSGAGERAVQTLLGLKTPNPLARYERVDVDRLKREHRKLRRVK